MDHRLDINEFQQLVLHHQHIIPHVNDIEDTFNTIDVNHGGYILFDEFCHWAITNVLEEQQQVPVKVKHHNPQQSLEQINANQLVNLKELSRLHLNMDQLNQSLPNLKSI